MPEYGNEDDGKEEGWGVEGIGISHLSSDLCLRWLGPRREEGAKAFIGWGKIDR